MLGIAWRQVGKLCWVACPLRSGHCAAVKRILSIHCTVLIELQGTIMGNTRVRWVHTHTGGCAE
jgi:hypothetical protein